MHTYLTRSTQALQNRPAAARTHSAVHHVLHRATVQTKLKVGSANDPAEREADRVADKVMRMPGPNPIRRMCEDCEEEVNRKESSGGKTSSGKVSSLNLGQGSPLPASERAFFEPRFGHDFSNVRIHNDAAADQTAQAINARAFTYGNDVAFAKGEYSPGSLSLGGRKLMAHELTHTIQEEDLPGKIRRKVEVTPNAAAASEIRDQFHFMCPTGNFTVNRQNIESSCMSSSKSCDCLCDVTTDTTRTYFINVSNVTSSKSLKFLHNWMPASVPMPSTGPHTVPGNDPHIEMPSASGSALAFGEFQPSGDPLYAPNWRILAHELCGHARLNQTYAGSKGNRPGHDVTIDTENAIAGELGEPPRGKFNDFRQGESFHSLPASGVKLVFKLKDGWHFETVP